MRLAWFSCALLLPVAACNLVPTDTTAEREAAIRQHDEAVAAKEAKEPHTGFPPEEQALLAELREQSEEQRKKEDALQKRAMRESEQKRLLASWIRLRSSECRKSLNYTVCALPPELAAADEEAKCYTECEASILAALTALAKTALESCVGADRESEAVCRVELPPSAAGRAGGPLLPKGTAKEASERCTRECARMRAEAALSAIERTKAASSGEALMLAYKRCMLSVDSTHQAITYRIHDADLYRDLLSKADARCRAASRCDWLEKNSDDWRCSYGNGS